MPSFREAVSFDSSTGEYVVPLTFGGGLNTNLNELSIDLAECADGSENFDLTVDKDSFRARNAFDLKGTAPNAAEIRGFVELIKSDGTVKTLVQAGGTVYDYDGDSTFTEIGTVPSGSKLRGTRFSTSLVDDFVIITDLEKQAVVKKYDGTTFQDFAHNLSSSFFAKYCLVLHERALFGNVTDGTTALPHVLVGSGRGVDATPQTTAVETLSVSARPSSGATASDPFYLIVPDYRPINGVFDAFGKLGLSTQDGRIWYLAGEDKTDFEMLDLYLGSAASGDEAIVNAGNDVVYGRSGRIESLRSTETFGETSADDLSQPICADVRDVREWMTVYSPADQKAYFWPDDNAELWVWNKTALTLSPWAKWTTAAGFDSFRTTAASLVRRPTDNKDVVWFGGASGQIYELEGTGAKDAGTDDVTTTRVSGVIPAPIGQLFDTRGHVDYRKEFSGTVTLTFEYGGVNLFDQAITLTLPAQTGVSVWNGANYWGQTSSYWGIEFEKRLSRQSFAPTGQASHMQVRISTTGNAGFELHGGEIRFKAQDV